MQRRGVLQDQEEAARQMVRQGSEGVGTVHKEGTMGAQAEPSEVPLKDSKGSITGGNMLEFCLAFGRLRFKARSAVNCQL